MSEADVGPVSPPEEITSVGQICPLDGPSVNGCYAGCDQCPQTQFAWSMEPFKPFAGISPATLIAQKGCHWANRCVMDCDQCPDGTVAVWYVQILDCDLGLSSAVLVPQGRCRWSSCCPKPVDSTPLP